MLRDTSLLYFIFLFVCNFTLSWAQVPFQSANPLPEGRAFHGSAVVGNYIYVAGGQLANSAEGEGTASVVVAPIRSDGSLGAWAETAPLPGPRLYVPNSTLSHNGRLYILGGSDAVLGGARQNTVLYAAQQADGQLTGWQESVPFASIGVSSPAAVISQGNMYLLGGSRGGGEGISDQVFYAPILANGALGEWKQTNPLPERRWFHNAAATAGNLYVWGGLETGSNESAKTAVYASSIMSDGSLTGWNKINPELPRPIYSAVNSTVGPYVISIFPRTTGGLYSNYILWAQIDKGYPTNWQWVATPIPIKVYHSTAVDYSRGTLYVIGGKPERATSQRNLVSFYKMPIAIEQKTSRQVAANTAPSPSASSSNNSVGQASGAVYKSMLQKAGFIPYANVREYGSQTRGLPQILYFHIGSSRDCQRQLEELSNPAMASLTRNALFSWVDVSESPDVAQQYGVYRVPAWIYYDARGRLAGTEGTVQTADQLSAKIGQLR